MKRLQLLFALLFTLTIGAKAMAEPIGLIEKYALAADREKMLSDLIPGSEDHFFFHCLHYQVTGQLDESEAVLKNWLAVHKGRETPAITAMIDRQRLLTYGDSPERTIDHLIRRLGVNLKHAPPAVKGERRYPSRIDASELDVDKLVKEALQRNDQLSTAGLQHVAGLFRDGKTAGLRISLHEFLKRVNGPYIEGLDKLVAQELKSRRERDRKFGDLQAHQFLTLAELQSVARQVPVIADDNPYVQAVLQRLRPDADSDPSQQADVRLEYLNRIENYTRTLPSSYNSLKASSIYRLLEANLNAGKYDQELFLRYLQLPRNSPIVHPVWARRPSRKANLAENFMGMALLPPIRDERPLVRKYLEHFLKDAQDSNLFREYLQPEYLRQVFAETKLLNGVGNPEQWYKLLSPAQRQTVRDRTELRLASQNRLRYGDQDPTQLIVDIKNVKELVIRVYEINTLAYYRTHNRLLDTDIDLDGLVATSEKKLAFNQTAVRRHRETIELEDVAGRGVWVVDLVGKDLRARAMIRRGEIHHVSETTADGMMFTIINENREPIAGATMLVGSREFVADEKGRIALPPVKDQVSRRAIISDGKLSGQLNFNHLRESYQLSAGFHLDRTLVQSSGEAKLLVRPRLSMSGKPISPDTLSDVSVTITATDLDGISTTNEIEDIELKQTSELIIPFRVPVRLARLGVVLRGKVKQLATSQELTLQTSHSIDVASIRKTNLTHDAFLTRNNDQYVIEVRGRSGESVPHASVSISLQTDVRRSAVTQTLQTDENGQVQLSSLPGVTNIRYSVAGGLQHNRDLRLDSVAWQRVIHTTTERETRLPLAFAVDDPKEKYRLLELRGGGYHVDQTEKVSSESGLLVIGKLAAGDYQLVDRHTGKVTSLAVAEGPHHGSVVSGKVRHHSVSPSLPVGIASMKRDAAGLKIQLSGETKLARVHIYASRYLDSPSTMDHMVLPEAGLYTRRVVIPNCGYVSDLRLGDEYQYVLRRRYAAKYPGVMLPQAGVILNPWETEETSNTSQSARNGDVPPPASAAPGSAMRRAKQEKDNRLAANVSSDFDFLADAGVLVANLRPDENGLVAVPDDVVKGMPILRIVVMDPVNLLQRVIGAPLEKPKLIDLRLTKSLDIDKPLTFERAVSIVGPDKPLDLESLGSAQMQVYGSVGAVMKLYKTLTRDNRLSDFDELAIWHTLDQEAKLDAYSRLASHELHLFVWTHDRKFFDQVIKPYLMNKKEKQFVDDWLLDRDLEKYTQLWRYNQLSSAERALLAMRVDSARKMVRREMAEVVANQIVNQDVTRDRIQSALMLGDLSATDEKQKMSRTSGIAGGTTRYDSRSRGRAAREIESLMEMEVDEDMAFSDKFALDQSVTGGFAGRGMMGGGGAAPAFFRELDSTKQWAESHWDRVRTVGGPSPVQLIGTNAFWADLSQAEAFDKLSVSSHLLEPVQNRHSALVALAFCGLPLQAGEIGLPMEPNEEYKPEHAVAVVTKRLMTLEQAEGDSSILIGQRFTQIGQATKRNEIPSEPTEFLTGIGYKGQTVISNPTAARRVVNVFWQIPAGSIPLGGSQITDSKTVTLEPFAVQSIEYTFYFPSEGQFVHYPATIANEGTLVSRGSKKTFNVVEQATEDDKITWEKIARRGTPDELRDFLAQANLRELNWMLVAHRMQDQEVYKVIINTLSDANLVIPDLWAYSLKHRDVNAMKSFLAIRADLVSRVGPVLDSELLEVQPIERRTHEVLEYAPLVRARIHRLGQENEILNPTYLGQYRNFVRVLAYNSEIKPAEQFVLSYYLLLQNRIEEAISRFAKIDRGSLETKLQYDYASAYLAMHREDFGLAEKLASQHANHPIPRWANRFNELASQLQQRKDLMQVEQLVSADNKKDPLKATIKEGSGDLSVMDRERRQERVADMQPEVVVRVEGNSLRIDHRRAKEVTLNLYGVDLELLFSKAPFVREDLQRMAMVRPTKTETIEFADPTGTGKFELDDNLSRQTLLVEVVAGASRSTALYYGGQITTYVSESFGQLQTTDAKTHRPVSTAYVKVYARYPNGSVRFYKDGYTDSRGRFDYASISANDAKGANRFAILVLSEEKGATLHDVATPTQ